METTDPNHTRPAKTITVMADFGMGPYAWLKDTSDETTYVGGNIADSESGFPDYISVSEPLERDFAEWVAHYEEKSLDEPEFDWDSFNSRGLELSRRLKRELGDTFRVVYYRQSGDGSTDNRIEINYENDRNA